MAFFTIEQYEVWSQKRLVEAENAAEAVQKVLDGAGDMLDNELEYIETCESMGLPVAQNERLADHLKQLGVVVTDVIPSIRSIEEE
jgi:hypothetical protein